MHLLMRQTKDIWVVSMIETICKEALIEPIEERLGIEALKIVIMNFIAMI